MGRVLGCSVNDLLAASVAGALRDCLAQNGDATAGVELSAVVPVDLRPSGSERELGNRFGVVGVELPVGIENPLARQRGSRAPSRTETSVRSSVCNLDQALRAVDRTARPRPPRLPGGAESFSVTATNSSMRRFRPSMSFLVGRLSR